MALDIFHSRRGAFRKCYYWKRDESKKNALEYQDNPSGLFYAKESATYVNQENEIEGVAMLDENMTTLMTNDDIDDLKRGDIVKYRDSNWVVISVSVSYHMKETEFSRKPHATRYINIRK